MYLIEFIIKKITQRKRPAEYNPLKKEVESQDEFEQYENCEHLFMPLDSTNEVLSCAKCGTLVKRSELKDKNFFRH